jgi:tRNA nucleotidyltransferase/poly(A) polymerase
MHQLSFVSKGQIPEISPLLKSVAEVLPKADPVYLVGGAVRDMLLQHQTHDLDFVVQGDALKVARDTADALHGAYYNMNDEHPTGRVIITGVDGVRHVMDFASMRGASLEEDLRGRDFTINAMATSISQPLELIDPFRGATDLANKRLRACSPNSIVDDPVRILRGVRLAISLSLNILPETRNLMQQAKAGLVGVSAERLRDALFRILDSPKSSSSLRMLDIMGTLPYLLPELTALKDVQQPPPHVYDVWEHTLHAVDKLDLLLFNLAEDYDYKEGGDLTLGLINLRLGRYRQRFIEHFKKSLNPDRGIRSLLSFAALYHDAGKFQTQILGENGQIRTDEYEKLAEDMVSERAKALRLSKVETERIACVVRNHMRPHHMRETGKEPTRRSVYRYYRDTEEAGVDIGLLSLADLLATYSTTLTQDLLVSHLDTLRILYQSWWEERAERVLPVELLNGRDLINTLKIKQGPEVGRLLEAIREAQATGDVHTRDEALVYAKEWLRENT